VPTETKDQNSFGFSPTTLRGKVTCDFTEALAVSTTARDLFVIDSAEFGGVSCALTVFNRAASAASVRLRLYVSNDRGRIGSSAGWITVSTVYDESNASVSLPLTIAAGATDFVVFDYASLPKLTAFRFWRWTIDTAASTATIDAYFSCK